MPLIKCMECGKEISDRAESCPNCGYPIKATRPSQGVSFETAKYSDNHINAIRTFHPISIIGFIVSIFSIIFICLSPGLGMLLSITAFVLSIIGMTKKQAKGLSIAGIVISPITFAICVFAWIFTFGENEMPATPEANTESSSQDMSIKDHRDKKSTENEVATSIESFKYDINNNSLVLKNYKGNNSVLYIKSQYTIENKIYEVSSLKDFQVNSESVKTLILSDGITELNDSIFNGCNVEKIFFPKSITTVYDNTLAYLDDDNISVYYEGSEEEWKNIFTEYEPNSISTEIEKKDAEGVGVALADKLNTFVGHEYESAKFTFYYNSTIKDIQ